MGRVSYYVDTADYRSVESLITAFGARGTHHESAIRTALRLHPQPFVLFIDYVNRPELSPLDDAFAYNAVTGEMALYSDEPTVLVEAILDLALLRSGFETLARANEEWEPHVAVGARRYVRQALKVDLNLEQDVVWRVGLELATVEVYNLPAFMSIIYLASRPNVEVIFPDGTNAMAIIAFQRLSRIMEAIAFGIKLAEPERFNRRLHRAVDWVLNDILPSSDISPFDDLLGQNGFNERFFEDDPGGITA